MAAAGLLAAQWSAGAAHLAAAHLVAARRGRERFLVVRLAGKEFALETPLILGMMQMRGLPMDEIDGPPGWRWRVTLHGQPLPVYTPNRKAGVAERPVSARTCLLLVGSVEEPGNACFGLQVDSISRYEELGPGSIRGTRKEGRKVRLSQKWRPVLDLAAICLEWLEPGRQS